MKRSISNLRFSRIAAVAATVSIPAIFALTACYRGPNESVSVRPVHEQRADCGLMGQVPLRLPSPARPDLPRIVRAGTTAHAAARRAPFSASPAAIYSLEPAPLGRRMRVTAYCPCEICCGEWSDGYTASGRPVAANGGRFCAAPPDIPFGTMIDIPGYGCVPVLDRGGAIQADRLDVFFATHARAVQWGVQYLIVTVYLPVGRATRCTRN